ncbi:hypothetical protein [Geodermatophilus sp. URMC 63]
MTSENPGASADLTDCEFPLDPESSEKLWRQVFPKFWDGKVLSSQAFGPGEDGKVSVDRESKVGPKDAFEHFTQVAGKRSAGVWAVRVNDTAALVLRN